MRRPRRFSGRYPNTRVSRIVGSFVLGLVTAAFAATFLAACATVPSAMATSPRTLVVTGAKGEPAPEASTARLLPGSGTTRLAALPEPFALPIPAPEPSMPRRGALVLSLFLPLMHEPHLAALPAEPEPAPRLPPENVATLSGSGSPSIPFFSPATVPDPPLPGPLSLVNLPSGIAAKPVSGAPQIKVSPAPASQAPTASAVKPVVAKPATAKPADASVSSTRPKATEAPLVAAIPLAPPSTIPLTDPKAEKPKEIGRHMTVEQGSRVEIPFEGTGWTYLGDREGREGLRYDSRRFEGAGLVFVISADSVGDFVLRFQRQDLLRGNVYDEFVALTVSPRPLPRTSASILPLPLTGGSNSVGSPGSSTGLSAAGGSATSVGPDNGSKPAATDSTNASATIPPLSPAPDSPQGLLLAAKNELGAGRVRSALDALDRFIALYPAGMDEVFYLYGLAYEQNGPFRNIKKAYDCYRKLVADYPQSSFWGNADERISYIQRNYLEIR